MTTGALPAASELPDLDTALPASVLDDVACLVVVVDTTGRVVHVNRALELLLGRPREALVGRPMTDLVDPADRQAVEQAVSSPTGPLSGVEAVLPGADGARRRVLWAARRTPGPDPRVVLTGIDVTPEGQASGLFSQLVRSAATPALVATD
ncbi:MAG: PAS domain-containing protein, partial [Marmoricola sp.]|nr:PAS domain-containing protein [Marmoricola sp.]